MWTRIWAFLDRCFFAGASARPGALGATLRVLRYPYAVLRDLSRGEINLRAMGLVYTTLLSLIPLLAFSFAILKVFGGHREFEPIVHEFFRPVGDAAAAELTSRVMQFANRVSSGVVGSVGLVVLAWTLIGTINKVEDSFNYVWHVALSSAPVQEVVRLPLLQRLRGTGIVLAPYAMVTAFFTALYMMVPNTRVRWRAGGRGGVGGGRPDVHRLCRGLHSPHDRVRGICVHRGGAALDVLRLADPPRRRPAVLLRAEPGLPAPRAPAAETLERRARAACPQAHVLRRSRTRHRRAALERQP